MSIIDEIIPTIEHRLTVKIKLKSQKFNFTQNILQVSNEKHRRDAAKVIAYVTSSPNNDFAQRYYIQNQNLYQLIF